MKPYFDKDCGLVKVYWEDVCDYVSKIEPIFTKIVNKLSPNKNFPLYLAYYPYGAIKGDTKSTFLPAGKNKYYRLSDPTASADVIKNLGYGINSAPLAMLLEKNLELFVDLQEDKIIIPRLLYVPGAIFPYARILSRENNRIYAPNGVLTLSSGARSAFMLPNIGCATQHSNLRRDFNVHSSPPKTLYEHWQIFKEIMNSNAVNKDWHSCLMYFSQSWLDKLYKDKSWLNLKLYLHELAWKHYEYQRNRFYYDVAFSMIQKTRNLKPNPYLADTARHLFSIALGAAPGYIPACNDEALPLEMLQKVYKESYGLKKYYPSVLHPSHFNFENTDYPIYYSLQHPSMHVFSPKSRKISSTLTEMRELEHITKVFTLELAKNNSMCSDTILGKISREVEFGYYHNKSDRHKIIKSSNDLIKIDSRFGKSDEKNSIEFATDATFVRGCISISKKN